MRRYLLLAAVLCQPLLVNAAELHDATGRTVQIPDHATQILPAGPPAAVLLEALAPDLMVGWPHAPSAAAHAWLPEAVVALPTVPTLTGRQDVTDQVAPCTRTLSSTTARSARTAYSWTRPSRQKQAFLQSFSTELCLKRRRCSGHLALLSTGRIGQSCWRGRPKRSSRRFRHNRVQRRVSSTVEGQTDWTLPQSGRAPDKYSRCLDGRYWRLKATLLPATRT
jgi:hypothetical protein